MHGIDRSYLTRNASHLDFDLATLGGFPEERRQKTLFVRSGADYEPVDGVSFALGTVILIALKWFEKHVLGTKAQSDDAS